jgi:hypothetical protein
MKAFKIIILLTDHINVVLIRNLRFYKLKPTVIILLLAYPFIDLKAQEQLSGNEYYIDSQIKFSLSALLQDNLELTHESKSILKSRMCPSSEVTISYHKNIYDALGVNIGMGLGLATYNFHYRYNSPDNQPYIGQIYEDFLSHNEYVQDLYVFPISLDYIHLIKGKPNLYFYSEIGLKINRKVAYPYEITTEVWYDLNDSTEIVLFDFLLHNTEKRSYLSYFFKYGVAKNTKKLNTLKCNFVLHFSPAKIGKGSYNFYYLPVESFGTVKQNLNYVGFEFTYGLTLKKKSGENN